MWLDTPLGFHRHPAVTLHGVTRDQIRVLAAHRGLPWPPTRTAPTATTASTGDVVAVVNVPPTSALTCPLRSAVEMAAGS